MLLKSLKLKNFRQFIGEQKINFETNKKKNITVILGINTSGKTTLIKSFKWILYGESDFVTKTLLNKSVAENLAPKDSAKVSGEINLIHNETEYIITREQDYYRNSSGEVEPMNANLIIQYKTENGQLKYLNVSQQIDTINKILPEDLSDYFFFHGEKIKEIGENNRSGKKNIKEAVESILGLETLNSAIKHLSGGKKISVIGKLRNQIDSSKNEKLKSKKEILGEKETKLEKIRDNIDEYQDVIESLEEEVKSLNSEIKNNLPAKQLKNDIENNLLAIKENELEKDEKIKQLFNLISEESPMFFMQPLLQNAIEIIDDYKDYKESIPEMHADTIDYLINERKQCICGEEIKEGTKIYNDLIELKKYLPPESIGTIIRLFKNNIRHYSSIGKNFTDKYKNLYRDVRKFNKKIKELESLNKKLSDQIKDKPNVGELEAEVNKINSDLNDRRKKLKDYIKKEGQLENEIKSLNSEIEKIAEEDEKNKFILHCLKYAESINKKFENHYKKLEISTKNKLESKTKDIFSRIYHGNRNIILKENYEYILTSDDIANDDELDKSEGLKTVASFSFIAGIVSLAKEKVNDIDDDISEVETESYPLVMDAPFSDTDEKHIKNISKVIPDVTEQTIMIIMEKDWKYAKSELENNLNRLYKMNKEKETITRIGVLN